MVVLAVAASRVVRALTVALVDDRERVNPGMVHMAVDAAGWHHVTLARTQAVNLTTEVQALRVVEERYSELHQEGVLSLSPHL